MEKKKGGKNRLERSLRKSKSERQPTPWLAINMGDRLFPRTLGVESRVPFDRGKEFKNYFMFI